MAGKIFLHLFYGNDSLASSEEVQKWAAIFEEKYGCTTRYLLEADELGSDALLSRLSQLVEECTLFPQPKLLLLKRLQSLDTTSKASASRKIADYLRTQQKLFDENTVLIVWEPLDLAEQHPLLQLWQAWAKEGLAQLHRCQAPTPLGLESYTKKLLKGSACSLTPAALAWLKERYLLMEKNLRLQAGVKRGEVLRLDERTWWLRQVISIASLLTDTDQIDTLQLQAAVGELEPVISPFDIIRLIERSQLEEARRLLHSYASQAQSDADWYSLLGALRWFWLREWQQNPNSFHQQALLLLGEIELLAKNSTVEMTWLVELAFAQLTEYQRDHRRRHLLLPRKAWLYVLSR